MINTGIATDNGTPNGAFDSVAAFDSMLFPEEKRQEAEAKAPDDADEAELEDQESASDENSETDESAEEADQAEGSETQTYTVRVDGEEVKVPIDELLSGYSRTADYTRKTQALANERKSFEQELGQVRAERAEYGTYLNQLRGLVAGGMGQEPNWDQLRVQDPVGFAVQRQDWALKQEQLQRVDAERVRLSQVAQAEAEQRKQAHLAEQRAMLPRLVPEWTKPEAMSADREKIVKAMSAVGYRPEEMQIFDARAMTLLRKAALYDEIILGKPALDRKVAAAKVAQPGRPVKPKSEAKRAMDRLSTSGKLTDAASLFEHLF